MGMASTFQQRMKLQQGEKVSILHILNQIAADPSRKTKEAILEANKDNELLKAVFKACYDPTISYYIKKIPKYDTSNQHMLTFEQCLARLEYLSSRKITGNDAIMHLISTLQSAQTTDAVIIERIIDRDLKCGATASTANKIWKNLIPETPYQRCSLIKDAKFDKWDWKKGVYSQLKADAIFCYIDIIDSEAVLISSRTGSQFPLDEFHDLIQTITSKFPSNSKLSGELQVARDGVILPRELGNGILNSVSQGGKFAENERAVYSVWDILPLDQVIPGCKINIPYSHRYDQLKSILDESHDVVRLIETRIVHDLDEAYAHYFELIAMGLEGVIIKNPDAGWVDSTSKDQIKIKINAPTELRIIGFNEGNGKNAKTFGSIICQTSDGKLEVGVSGFTDKEREEIHAKRDEMIGRIITVTFNNIMKPTENNQKYSLFLPRFTEFRNDRNEADSLERVIEQFEAIMKPKDK